MIKELIDHKREVKDSINAIADTIKREEREMNENEREQFRSLSADLQQTELLIAGYQTEVKREVKNEQSTIEQMREALNKNNRFELKLNRDVTSSDAVFKSVADSGGIVPITTGQIIEPLTEGLITNAVGITMHSGLVGDYVWPVYEAMTAQVAGEGVALTPQVISMSKLTANPQRVGIATTVTREAINGSAGVIVDIITKELPMALARLINKMTFNPTATTGSNYVGPVASKVTDNDVTALAGATPTGAELAALKGAVLESGVGGDHLAWVMTKSMEAALEVTPINTSGVYKPICENHMILGIPVFTTNEIDGYICLGDWAYLAQGLFGDITYIVDPYSNALSNAVNFSLNANYSATILRDDAFVVASVTE